MSLISDGCLEKVCPLLRLHKHAVIIKHGFPLAPYSLINALQWSNAGLQDMCALHMTEVVTWEVP